uniref:Mitochondrial import inner membrane translocase subunit TIM50 n=1 Tax=Nicotiana tabacum TaxID=4097 RepID=A0A1S4D011_TOBAC|nr:PREDICTED: CTD small phosphatase-like protein 2 isoform X1 [Nicotiana tabacum]
MPELFQATQVYTPRTIQLWKSLLNWLAFFFQIFLQILKGNSSLLSSSPQFKPLPDVELLEEEEEAEAAPSSVALSTLQITTGNVPTSLEEERSQRLTVVLDLDDTLICAYETSSMPTMMRTQATEAGLKWFELECISSDKEYDGKPKINYVTVFERPGLHEFLKQLSKFANLVLFTAGLEGYARPLVDKIDPENWFSHRLYRPSTISTRGPRIKGMKIEEAVALWT